MARTVSDFLIYKWRYFFGYTLLVISIAATIIVAGLYIPGELRQAEIDTAMKSTELSISSLTPDMVVNLPYHGLQRVAFEIFGISTLTIKLPSLIIGTLTALGIFLLLRTWFRRNIAVIVALLMTTSTQFLFLVQDGTPLIMHGFISVWLLFAAMYVTRLKLFSTFWKVLTGVLMAISFYIPFGVYLVAAMLITMLFHPHVRHIVKQFPRAKLTVAFILGLASLVPVVYASTMNPQIALQLLGIPLNFDNLPSTAVSTFISMFGFFSPSTDGIIQPLYSMGITVLIALGVYKLVTYKYTARSYIVSIWTPVLLVLTLIGPGSGTVLFPAAVILVASGISMLITDWYKLFPRNPYARIAGLVPLSVVVVGIMASGIVRYVNNYQYNDSLLAHYSKDLSIIKTEAAKSDTFTLVASEHEKDFYNAVSHYHRPEGKMVVIAPEQPLPDTKSFAVTRQARIDRDITGEPVVIITNSRAADADRLYIYSAE